MTQQELELPKGWVETKLDDIAIQLQSGGTPSTKIVFSPSFCCI